MPDEDKIFSGSLALNLRIWWCHVHILYKKSSIFFFCLSFATCVRYLKHLCKCFCTRKEVRSQVGVLSIDFWSVLKQSRGKKHILAYDRQAKGFNRRAKYARPHHIIPLPHIIPVPPINLPRSHSPTNLPQQHQPSPQQTLSCHHPPPPKISFAHIISLPHKLPLRAKLSFCKLIPSLLSSFHAAIKWRVHLWFNSLVKETKNSWNSLEVSECGYSISNDLF